MSGRLSIENGKIVITKDNRTVFTTDGTLVCMLPTVQTFTKTVTFPDFPKDYWYHWEFLEKYDSGNPQPYAIGNFGQAFFTRTPQELSQPQTLMVAPAGADIFLGSAMLTRTIAPVDTWGGEPIDCLVVQNQWIPWRGSAVVEQMLDMARAIHIYIDNTGKLLLELQQTLGPPPAGYGSFGDSAPVVLSNKSGHVESYGVAPGIPVWTSDSVPYKTVDSGTGSSPASINWKSCQLGQSKAASIVDPSNYASTYSVSIRGRFGRRS